MAKFKDGDIVGLVKVLDDYVDMANVCRVQCVTYDIMMSEQYICEDLTHPHEKDYTIDVIGFDQMYELLPLGKLLYDQ